MRKEWIEKVRYGLKFLLFFLILFFAWLAFEDFFAHQFQKLGAILSKENNGLLIWIFAAICLLCLLYIAFKHYRQRVFSLYFFGMLAFIFLVYLRYRIFWEFSFWGLWEGKWKINEDDYILALLAGVILPALCFIFILWKKRKHIWDRLKSVWNALKSFWNKRTKKKGIERIIEKVENNFQKQSKLHSDEAKKLIAEDKYNFKPHVEKFVEKIRNIQGQRSIGLLGDWGSGKSTYMNMVKEKLEKEKCIIVEFNPRHSKSIDHIQKDFFNLLEAELEVYDMTISHNLNKYLNAIGVNSPSKLVSFFVNILGIVYEENEIEKRKRKISKSIQKIDKQIVIFIDDFDRLLCNEILEVLKLTDGYLNFESINEYDNTNVIFISAYDKRQVTEIFSKTNIATPHKFAEKFFDTEQNIPLHRKDLIEKNFKNLLSSNLDFYE